MPANLDFNLPALDERAAKRAREAQRIELSQALAQAPKGQARQQAQAIAPAATTAIGGAEAAAQAGVTQQLQQTAETELQGEAQRIAGESAAANISEQETRAAKQAQDQLQLVTASDAAKTKLSKAELATQKRMQAEGMAYDNRLAFMSQKQREDLAKLGADVKEKLFDSRLVFEEDELGRKFTNERQLADFAVATAESEEQLKDRMQSMQEFSEKNIIMLEAAYGKLEQLMTQESADRIREIEQQYGMNIAEMKSRMQKVIAQKKKEAQIISGVVSGATKVATAGA